MSTRQRINEFMRMLSDRPQNRQIGKTSAAILLAQSGNHLLITHTSQHAYAVKQEHGVDALAYSSIDTIRGTSRAVVVDHYAYEVMILELLAELEKKDLDLQTITNESNDRLKRLQVSQHETQVARGSLVSLLGDLKKASKRTKRKNTLNVAVESICRLKGIR